MSGLFITFEGIEGCGKSTQSKLLRDYFLKNNKAVLSTREPGGPEISEAIRSILLNPIYDEMLPETELLLYMASRAQHTGQWILPALKNNKVVISDRYNDSTIAYQGAARNIAMEKILPIQNYATFGLVPDISFLIDLPVEIGLGRIPKSKADRIEQESIEFHKKVRQGFLRLAEQEKARYCILDGTLEIDEITTQIIQCIEKRYKQ